ncbi:hypothetical protein LPY66_19640 [Dehalobacter sp. DCM]|uniref:hypothetical protein n=1 Tax=Dehalobacter sp. DCM TaxID=2907827 RepID=UPI003081E7A4|nr:hypothetical protein LPY66_19640 [Dehalobacter sp. DCM]
MKMDPYNNEPYQIQPKLKDEQANTENKIETIAIQDAMGRLNYRKIVSEKDLPKNSVSMVDGIAVKTIYFNLLDAEEWSEGYEYIYRKAGMEIPYGFDAVVPLDEYEIDADDKLKIVKIPQPGQNIILAGSLLQKNQLIAPALAPLGQLEVALLKAVGIRQIEVLTENAIHYLARVRKMPSYSAINIF